MLTYSGADCVESYQCGEDCFFPPDVGCYNPIEGNTNLVTCPDMCGAGIDFNYGCYPYCKYVLMPPGFDDYGYCLAHLPVSINGCVGDYNEQDPCTPIGCTPGGTLDNTSGGASGAGTGNEEENICVTSVDGTTTTCETFPSDSLTTTFDECDNFLCGRCGIQDTASGTACNACSFCPDGSASFWAFDCTNLIPDSDCDCDGNCGAGTGVGATGTAGGSTESTTDGSSSGGLNLGGQTNGGGGAGGESSSSSSSLKNGQSASTASPSMSPWNSYFFGFVSYYFLVMVAGGIINY